jgi:ankyrin repeat protein
LIITCAYYGGADVNAVTVNGETALMLAAANAKSVSLLIFFQNARIQNCGTNQVNRLLTMQSRPK